MLISVLDLEREPLEFQQTFSSGAIDYGPGIRQLGDLPVEGRAELIAEHRGPHRVIQDIRLRAKFRGRFEALCARCLEPVEHTLEDRFDLLFRPSGADAEGAERAISTSDTEIGYYQEGSLAVDDVLREQVLLSLPAKTLCRQGCRGLCPGCGRNLNTESCTCEAGLTDPRWATLADLRSRMNTQS